MVRIQRKQANCNPWVGNLRARVKEDRANPQRVLSFLPKFLPPRVRPDATDVMGEVFNVG